MFAVTALAIETYTTAFSHSFTPSDLAAHLEKHLSPGSFARMIERDTILIAETGGRMVGYVQFGQADASFPA